MAAAPAPVRIDTLPADGGRPQRTHIERFADGASEIHAHCFEPNHPLRWGTATIHASVIGLMGLFWSVIGNVQSDLELSQWRGNLLELASVLTHHVFTSVEGGLIHLDCGVAYEIADVIQTGLTAVCKIQARIAGEIPTIECALGWVQHNRYCRVRTPEGLIGHNGPAALGFLHLVNVARNAIRGLMPNRPNQALDAIQPSAVPGFRIDMSWLVIDRESECYLGLRSIFSSLVAITAFMPLVEPELNDIVLTTWRLLYQRALLMD